ncbi:MAG: DUF3467 domain-containing protein [Candidatus Rokuibacteriota bacterium]
MPQGDEPSAARWSLQGRYANYFQIGHNAFEFVLDFGQAYEADDAQTPERIDLHTRLITSPPSARALSQMLRESLERYERAFGRPAGDSDADAEGAER